MTVVTTEAFGRPYTVSDLEKMPDDGHRYELLDGVLIVSPAPGRRHQRAAALLWRQLEDACPDTMEVLIAPFGVQPSPTTELQPDVLVARVRDLTERNLPAAPVLAVEVVSPSTRLIDQTTKKAAYQRLGVPSYWLVDPEELVLTAFELDETGEYRRVAEVKGEEEFAAERPFPVRIVPADWGRRGR